MRARRTRRWGRLAPLSVLILAGAVLTARRRRQARETAALWAEATDSPPPA